MGEASSTKEVGTVQYIILALLLSLTGTACRGIRREPRLYRLCAILLSAVILLAMAVQEIVLLHSGLLSWATGLPLHLCSLLGVLTPAMLLTRSRTMRSAALFLGIPGASLALIFPAVLATPCPRLTALAFHTLHAGLICAPLLPMAEGWKPRPADALRAGGFLLGAAGAAMIVNPLSGGNYLFLAYPIAGTPLAGLGQWGMGMYRLLLGLLAGAVLALGATIAGAAGRRRAG